MVGAQFNSVGAEALNIQDITLVGDGANGGSWIKWWDSEGKKYSAQAVYVAKFTDPEDDEKELDYGGWADEDWYEISKTFAPGEGFWFSPSRNSVGITTAGAVEKSGNQYVGRTVEVANQQIMVINAFPTALNIQSIVLDGDGANGGSWIKWWNPEGKKYSAQAVYVAKFTDPEDDEKELDYGGWADEDWYEISKSFDVGDGFWFSPSRNNVTICFPNPFYSAE